MTKRIFLGLTFAVVVLLYLPVFSAYFSGDDFFHFSVSVINSGRDLVKHFWVYPIDVRGYAFYRPLFREVLYGLSYAFFGLNPFPLRLLAIGIHLLNISLVSKLGYKLFKSNFLAGFAAFFFGISAANVGVLYYLAGGIQAQGATLFLLLTLLAFLENRKVLVFVFYLLGLASHEQAATIPILLGGLALASSKNFGFRDLKQGLANFLKGYWALFIILAIYLFLNFFYIGFSAGEVQYQLNFSPTTVINTLAWYSAWAFGLPEMLVDFVGSGFALNPNLLRYWGSYYQFIFTSFFASALLLAVLGFLLILKKRKQLLDSKFGFAVFWFALVLLPVMFLPLHKKTYYLAPALPAFWMAVGFVLSKSDKVTKYSQVIKGSLFALLVILTISSVKLAEKTYWAINRAKVAEVVLNELKGDYPTLSREAVIYIKNDPSYPYISESWGGTSTQTNLALSGPDAIRLMYKDASLIVYYEDLHPEVPAGALEFTAVIN